MYEPESEKEHSESEFYYPDEYPEEIHDNENTGEVQPLQNSQDEIENLVSGQQGVNTIKKTRGDVNTFDRYLTSVGRNNIVLES